MASFQLAEPFECCIHVGHHDAAVFCSYHVLSALCRPYKFSEKTLALLRVWTPSPEDISRLPHALPSLRHSILTFTNYWRPYHSSQLAAQPQVQASLIFPNSCFISLMISVCWGVKQQQRWPPHYLNRREVQMEPLSRAHAFTDQ